ncbi:MAG TPA: hypothetical protein VFO10_01040 [Oligoflexus sp.]|uniref:hypothetical protein n=1 Tax=Oligoflexus sp. TaxID=1971216 RepID=UPI002D7E75A2|nr:hypothetical protein [Oligoflexus sp.]HET9235801.1 hypothetical protein [Oligoflexus sp.]
MKTFLITLSLGLISTGLHAYGPCDEDVQKLCTGEFHQETERTCLHKKVEQLSAECKAFVKSKEDSWKKIMTSWDKVKVACQKEIDKECADVKVKAGEPKADEPVKALQVCLMMVSENLGGDCKKDMNRHIKEFQPNIREIP